MADAPDEDVAEVARAVEAGETVNRLPSDVLRAVLLSESAANRQTLWKYYKKAGSADISGIVYELKELYAKTAFATSVDYVRIVDWTLSKGLRVRFNDKFPEMNFSWIQVAMALCCLIDEGVYYVEPEPEKEKEATLFVTAGAVEYFFATLNAVVLAAKDLLAELHAGAEFTPSTNDKMYVALEDGLDLLDDLHSDLEIPEDA